MAEYLTNDTDLTKVANAIRNVGDTDEPLSYPDGFAAAANEAANKFLRLDGSKTMTGALDMGSQRVTNVGAPAAGDDAARKSDLDAFDDSVLLKSVEGSDSVELPSAPSWANIAFGNGKFVAVPLYSGKAAYSTDGITWNQSEMPNYGSWFRVAYGGGKFVAVQNGGNNAAYSEDGVNWTATTLPNSAPWYAVAYGNGKFVAIGLHDSVCVYSEDGVNWTASTMPSSGDWFSAAYGGGVFVAVTRDSTAAAYSEDGVNWTATTLPSSASWFTLVYGGGRFIAIAESSTAAAYSEDGVNWTATTLPNSAKWYSSAYGNGKFVSAAYDSDICAYSEDGISWTASTMPNGWWKSTAYGGNRFVVISDNGRAAHSTDGITWSDKTISYALNSTSGADVSASVYSALSPYASPSNVPTKTSELTNDSGFITAATAPVTSVNSKTGAVTLTASDVGALPDSTVIPTASVYDMTKDASSADYAAVYHLTKDGTNVGEPINIPNGASVNVVAGNGLSADADGIKMAAASGTSAGAMSSADFTKLSGIEAGAQKNTVTSVNGATGAVTVTAPVTSVNTKTGAVTLTASDVGALPDTTTIPTKTSELTNDSGYITQTDGDGRYLQLTGGTVTGDVVVSGSLSANAGSTKSVTLSGKGIYLRAPVYLTHAVPTADDEAVSKYYAELYTNQYAPHATLITLTTSGWNSTSKTQTVTVSGILADESKQLIIVMPATASMTAYSEAGIQCTGQAANRLTFTADTVPTAAISVYVTYQTVIS